MKILISGAFGFLGRVVSASYNESGNTIISLGIENENNIICDLSKEVPLLTDKIEVVIHAAGKAHVIPRTAKEAEDFFSVNFQGTQHLLTALERSEKIPQTIVFISTVAVYGVETGLNIDETSPLLGGTPYADSKIKAEELLVQWGRQHQVNVLILRLPLLVGANAPGNLGSMIKAIRKGYYFRIGDGSARRSMVLAEDVALFLPHTVGKNGIYNLTDGYHPSFKEIEDTIAGSLSRKIRKIPMWLATAVARVGDLLPFLPVSSLKIAKITQSLTFSDKKARTEIGWNSRSVIENFKLT